MNVLITGGAGFIGSHLAEGLKDHEVTVFDNLSTGKHIHGNFIKGDVNDINQLEPAVEGMDYIYHYAAVVGVQRTLENPLDVLDDIQGIRNILDLSVVHGIKKVLYSSSSEVYGEPFEIPQHEETTPLNSRLPYAVVKNVGEACLQAYKQAHGLDYTIFRFFNTYGPRQSTDFVMSRFIKKALSNEPIPIYGDGDQTRTFCHVKDNVDTCIKAMSEDIDIINVGSAEQISILQLAKRIIYLTNSNSEIVHLPPLPLGDMRRRQPDNTRMIKLLGRPLIELDDGIKQLIAL